MFGFLDLTASPHAIAWQLVTLVPIFLVSITLHEFAHALTAHAMGDPTPARAGRVTLNPLAHLDVLGTFMILLGPIGWAKPVPIDESRLGRWGTSLVSLAGPATNLLLAIAALAAIKHAGPKFTHTALPWLSLGFELNIALFVFNLLPIPPLDGSGILRGLLPPAWRPGYHNLLPYGIVLLLALVWLPGGGALISHAIDSVSQVVERLVP